MALLDTDKALQELQETSMAEIERATAITWGGRAVASYRLCADSANLQERFRHFYEGENYRQEALEHASMAEDRCKLLMQVHDEIEKVRNEALGSLRSGDGGSGTKPHVVRGRA